MDKDRLNEDDKSGFFSKLSRTLYIGNIDENINDATLYKYFEEFGDIISINFKKEDHICDSVSSRVYALIKYFDTSSVVLALLKMNGVNVEGCHVRLGFGKSFPSRCVWITGIKKSEDNNFLLNYLTDCGPIISCSFDQINKRALVYFKEIEDAEAAINKMKDGFINGLYFHGDYASTECQKKFTENYNKQKRKNCLSTGLDNVDSQNSSISNVNKQKSAASHCVEADSSCVTPKERTLPITCVWVNGIADSVTEEYLESHFSQIGPIKKCLVDKLNKSALLCFQQESHAQSAITITNGSFIKGKSVYVHLASIMCRDCEESNKNNDNFTIQQQDNTTQSSPYSIHMVPYEDFRTTLPSSRYSISNETCLTNISDPHNDSINVDNSLFKSQHEDLNIPLINIPKDPSKICFFDNSPITIVISEYPSETLKLPSRFANFDVLSLPLPDFAKNISKKPTSPSSMHSQSNNPGVDKFVYTFNVYQDKKINCSLGKTDEGDKKNDQNNNHSIKSYNKILESVKSIESEERVIFEEVNMHHYVFKKHGPKEFIQSQSSPKFQDQSSSSLQNILSTSDSSQYGLGSSASVIQPQYDSKSSSDSKFSSTSHKTSSKDLCSTSKHVLTMNSSIYTFDAMNSDFIDPIHKDEDSKDKYYEIIGKIRHEYTKNWVTTGYMSTNTPNYNCDEKFDHLWPSDISEKENQQNLKSELINKQKPLDRLFAENSIEPVVHSIFVDVEKSTNIDEDKTDEHANKKSISSILLSLNKNKQNVVSNETEDKIKKTNCNESTSSVPNNENKFIYYNHGIINEYKNHESENSSSTKSMRCKSHNIKPNKIQGVVNKTNFIKNKSKHLNINKNKELKKTILCVDHDTKEKKIKDRKLKPLLGSKSIDSKSDKSQLFEFNMFEINNTNNEKKKLLINSKANNIEINKDFKFVKTHTIKEDKQNVDILKNHKNSRKDNKYKKDADIHQTSSCFNLDVNYDKKSKKDIIKVDGNITSSYCSTENLFKRSMSNPSENHYDSKRLKTDSTNKTYKNNCTETLEHHSPVSKPIKNIHNNWKPENTNMNSKLNKTPNQIGTRGWMNGHSIHDILSNEPKVSMPNKIKARSTNNMKKKEEWKLEENNCNRKKIFESDDSDSDCNK